MKNDLKKEVEDIKSELNLVKSQSPQNKQELAQIQDKIHTQIISCKEWFPPNNYKYAVLKKDFYKSIKKIEKRI